MADSQNLTPLVPAAIKEHTKPILYGVAVNAITQIALLGVPAVIAWIATHTAIASGIPLHWAILIGSVVLFLLAMTANYVKSLVQKRRHGIETKTPQIEPSNRLTFEIDENDSQVHVGSDTREIRQIEAKIILRCKKHIEGVVSVRAIHASLHRLDSRGGESEVIPQERILRVFEWPSTQEVNFNNGWTIGDAVSNYRHFYFCLDIKPLDQATLSSSYFLRVRMDAIGQGIFSEDIRVNNWGDAKASNSSVMLRRNYQGNEEIERLHDEIKELKSANFELTRQKTNLERDVFNETRSKQLLEKSYEISRNEVREARADADAQTRTYDVTFNGMKEEIATFKHDAEESKRVIEDLKTQKFAIDNELQMTELKLGQWEWLTSEAQEQKGEIEKHVRLDDITLGDVILTGYDPTIRFGIHVTNRSFLDISLDYELDDSVKGMVEFNGYKGIKLLGSKRVVNTAKDIPPGGSGCLTIEQRLIDNEAKVIDDGRGWPPASFYFAGLTINIVGGKRTPDVTSAQLVMLSAGVVSAFNVNLQERGQRIRAMAEVRGSAQQLHEALRVTGQPLPKEVFEHWEAASLEFLKQVYEEKALARVWAEVTDQNPIPSTAASQQGWLSTRIVKMGAFLAELTGEYINRKTINA